MLKSQGRQLLFVIIIVDLLMVLVILGLYINKSRQPASVELANTPAPEVTPGLVVYGYVRSANGVGLEGVAIMRNYAAYSGVQVAMTNRAGVYQSDFYSIPGDEMVTIWAEQSGVQFQPATCSWRHYYGYEKKECNFEAEPASKIYLPNVNRSLRLGEQSGISSPEP